MSPPRGTLAFAIFANVPFIALQTWTWPANLAVAAFFAGAWVTAELVHFIDAK